MPLPEMFNGFFSSSAAAKMLAQVLGTWPPQKLTSSDPENDFLNAGLAIRTKFKTQDGLAFQSALQSLDTKLGLLSKPEAYKDDDIVSAVANQVNAALTLAKKASSGYQAFEAATREYVISQIVNAENTKRNELRPKQDSQGKATNPEALGDTRNEFTARYYGQMLRTLVGPPPDALQIGKSDKPDEYYLWSVYGLKRDPSMEFGLQVDGNIAAYREATDKVNELFKTYGAGTSKADEKILDDPNGDYKRSPNEFRAAALVGMIKALTGFYDATASRATDPSKSDDAKNAVIRSIGLTEGVRGAFGLATGQTSHSLAGLPRSPSAADRANFDATFPGVIKAWDSVGDTVRKDIAADPRADRSSRVPVATPGQ